MTPRHYTWEDFLYWCGYLVIVGVLAGGMLRACN